ncbi:hypothetical protein BAE30_15930 [Acidithiobacillus caldus]|uniref:Uncharacterized protein n=1 Tax=Acidithiobacillus caldus TaxID=33059 RepID=A0A1E7YRR1_9PROT|nr:hypothetical protein BAE30_15930 [Acidithiobacillus caldus]
MRYTDLFSGIYEARAMAENRGQHSPKEMLEQLSALDSTQTTLWEFVGAVAMLMNHTSTNRDAWDQDVIQDLGKGLAAVSDAALGIEKTKDMLLKGVANG